MAVFPTKIITHVKSYFKFITTASLHSTKVETLGL